MVCAACCRVVLVFAIMHLYNIFIFFLFLQSGIDESAGMNDDTSMSCAVLTRVVWRDYDNWGVGGRRKNSILLMFDVIYIYIYFFFFSFFFFIYLLGGWFCRLRTVLYMRRFEMCTCLWHDLIVLRWPCGWQASYSLPWHSAVNRIIHSYSTGQFVWIVD